MAPNPDMAAKAGILRELGRIVRTVERKEDRKGFDGARLFIESIFNPRTPTYEIGMPGMVVFLNGGVFERVPKCEKNAYLKLISRVNQTLFALGYRELATTCQEHNAAGSSQGQYVETPYKPIGILEGKLTIEEASRARILEVTYYVFGCYYGLDRVHVPVSLEPLDDAGNTVRDPRAVDMGKLPGAYESFKAGHMTFGQMLDACAMPAQRAPDFPFRRA